MKTPGFFIIGAPKCGTTSLARWLAAHPNVFFTRPKEPEFFSTDIRRSHPLSRREYDALFSEAGDRHLAVGEGSTGYLRSQVAVPAILREFPQARFIVCVRNPVDMAISLHSHLLRMAVEDEPDFQRAWDLQDARRAGRNIPRLCPEPGSLLYGEVCALGSQLERLYRLVPRERVLVIELSELSADPAACYRRALTFLDLPDDDRSAFPVENAGRRLPRWAVLLMRLGFEIKGALGIHTAFGINTRIERVVSRFRRTNVAPPVVPREALQAWFEPEIHLLEQLLGGNAKNGDSYLIANTNSVPAVSVPAIK